MATTELSCTELTLLLQADIDGELDAAQAFTLAHHLEHCEHCTQLQQQLLTLRDRLRGELTYQRPDASLEAKLRAQWAQAAQLGKVAASVTVLPSSRRMPWKPFASGALLAAAMAFLLVLPKAPNPADAVVAEHIRSLQAEHLLDVVSTDQHTVKPWFNGKLDFVPPVQDFATDGFPLIGGRLDYLNGRTVAALVYRHGPHPINVFVWPDTEAAATAVGCSNHAGYHLCEWSQSHMSFWAVSDMNAQELQQFVELWNARSIQ